MGVNLEEYSRSVVAICSIGITASLFTFVTARSAGAGEYCTIACWHVLEADPTLTPRDIIVMVADTVAMARFIRAVFGSAPAGAMRICHFRSAGASVTSRCYRHLSAYFRYRTYRFVSEDVLALLDIAGIGAARFGSQRREGCVICACGSMSPGIRWGIDDDNVRELELPAWGIHGNLA